MAIVLDHCQRVIQRKGEAGLYFRSHYLDSTCEETLGRSNGHTLPCKVAKSGNTGRGFQHLYTSVNRVQ